MYVNVKICCSASDQLVLVTIQLIASGQAGVGRGGAEWRCVDFELGRSAGVGDSASLRRCLP